MELKEKKAANPITGDFLTQEYLTKQQLYCLPSYQLINTISVILNRKAGNTTYPRVKKKEILNETHTHYYLLMCLIGLRFFHPSRRDTVDTKNKECSTS